MKTLGQIEPRTPIGALPFRIQTPGSYYVTTNLTGAAGSHGIQIEANDVTLDLQGFALTGLTNSLNGVFVPGSVSNIVVRNGTLKGWAIGVDARSGNSMRFEAVRLVQNAAQGLAAGMFSVAEACAALGNQGTGISADQNSIVGHCLATGNGSHGIFADTGSQVVSCTASSNSANGLVVAGNCVIAGSMAANNSATGIVAGASLQLSDSKAFNNGAQGVSAGVDATISHCSVSGNLGVGISATQSAQVLDCKSSSNAKGVSVQSGSMVRGCATMQNSGDGIVVTTECTVVGNTSTGNFIARDAAGIHATGANNIIRENHVLSNDMGVLIDVAGNFIIQNAAANNSLNFRIVDPAQAMGPIVSSSDVKSTTLPVANFEF
jgi:hypothetical protein